MKYFKGSFIFTLICLILSAYVGYYFTGTVNGALSATFICFILGIMEVSLSFDNAVVNATVLEKMSPVWQHRFLTWGILIAVFGMRLIFPLAIVSVATWVNPIKALSLAIHSPKEYSEIISSSHTMIMAFGGSFLALVGLRFFMDEEKESHWISPVEKFLAIHSKIKSFDVAVVLFFLVLISFFLPKYESASFVFSGIIGIVAYVIVDAIGGLLDDSESNKSNIVKAGLGTFIYLEMLDASFSFDGVIGSFALSTNLFIIALGLGIGAMFVRSLTVMLVDKGTLTEYEYLEHGAFWAILVLASIMFLNVVTNIPSVITGLLGASIIIIAFIHSVIKNRG